MIINYIHRLNGQLINPLNANFNIDFSFGRYTETDSFEFLPNANIDQDTLILVGADMKIVDQWIADQKIFEGIPYLLQFKPTGEMIFNAGEACLSCADVKFKQDPDRYELKIIDKRTLFATQAEALNLRVLLKQKVFSKSDYQPINYVYKSVPDYMQSAIISIAIYQTSNEIAKQIKDLAKDIVTATATLGAATGLFAVQVIYTATMIKQVFDLIELLSNSLFPRVRYYYAIQYKVLLKKACAYFGYNFESSILDSKEFNDLCLLSSKSEKGALFNTNSNDDPIPNKTLSEVLQSVVKMFNAKLKITGNEIRLERWDYFIKNTNPTVKIKNIRNDDGRALSVTNNANELKSNVTLTFLKDDLDQTTYQQREGYSAQIHTKVKNVNSTKFAFLKGVNQIELPFSRASRKDTQGTIETLFAQLIDFYEELTGSSTSLGGQRIGCMELPTDSIGVPKILKIENNGFINDLNNDYINADYLIKNFYEINTPLKNQQKTIIDEFEHPFTMQEVLELRKTGIALMPNGQKCLVEKLQFISEKNLYLISIRYFENYCNNLENIFTTS